MEMKTPESANSAAAKKKEYKKPQLSEYGSIADLVQMNPGAGTDGGAPLNNIT